ncbi:MAG: glycosyltransferase [Candidatus Bipolaricaulota bacterium]|nr:glycosyltransferase [Candidatus Bipolaricaulota bacterium]
MKIGFVTGAYLPAPGGVTTSVVNFSKQLRKLGQEVYIFCPNYPEEETTDDENVFRIPSYYSPLLKDFRLTDPFQAARIFRREFSGLDIVHIHLPTVMSAPARWIAGFYDVPIFLTYHTNLELYIRHYVPGVPKDIARALTRFYTSRETKNGEKVFVPSPDMESLLESYDLDPPLEVLPTGIDLETYEKENEGVRTLREQFGIKEGEKILLYVGRVGSEKNVGFLLDAFKEISRTFSPVHFVIVGGGRGLGKVLSRVSKMNASRKIHFTGYVEQDEVLAQYYREADLFLFASLTETQGLVIAEALAARTPVIAVDAPGVRDVIKGDKGGYLVPEDVSRFSKKVKKLLESPDHMNRKREEAKDVARNFSAEAMTRRLFESYVEVMGRKE